jgi:hypothetical protein
MYYQTTSKPARLLATITFLVCYSYSTANLGIFTPDFGGAYTGTGDNQFNYVGSAEVDSTSWATTSVVGQRFQMVTNHHVDSLVNQSATRLSRHGNSTSANALPFVDNFGLVSLEFRWNNTQWTSGDQSVFNIVIGEEFRSGAFNPARGGSNADGPSFASLNLQARTTEHQFRLIAGGGAGSSNFNLTKDGEGFYTASIFAAFNNSGTSKTVASPTGSYSLNTASLAIWINNVLVWDNYTSATNIRDAAFQHVSFGMGVGSNSDFATAQAFAGTYQLGNIVVSTVPEPATYAALLGLLAIGFVAWRRRR